jgi:hypothetical protein
MDDDGIIIPLTDNEFWDMLTEQWEAIYCGDEDPSVERFQVLHERLHGNRDGISDDDVGEYLFLSWALAEAIAPTNPTTAKELHAWLTRFRFEYPHAKSIFSFDPANPPFKQFAFDLMHLHFGFTAIAANRSADAQ